MVSGRTEIFSIFIFRSRRFSEGIVTDLKQLSEICFWPDSGPVTVNPATWQLKKKRGSTTKNCLLLSTYVCKNNGQFG